MKKFLTLWKKELASHFLSPGAYAVPALFLVVTGLVFWRLAVQNAGSPVTLSMLLFGPIFFWVMILLIVSLITMRLFVDERRQGTMETLITVPLREVQIVLAKYAGALTFFVAACAPSLAFFFVLQWLHACGRGGIDWGPIVGGYLILLLTGAFYISIGLFVSVMSRSHVVAGIACFSILMVAFFSGYFNYVLAGGIATNTLRYASSVHHVLDFASGLIDTRPIVLNVTGTIFMLFATTQVLQSERWR